MVEKARRDLGLKICNCTALRRAARRVSEAYDAKLEQAGLTAAQFGMLVTLGRLDSASVNRLADEIDLDRTTTGKSLRVLERTGLVRIKVSEEDGRSRSVKLTTKGNAALRAAMPLWRAAQHEFEKQSGRVKSSILRAMLAKLSAPK
ncbi:MarR family winged helix-turn-helix transcriptional regulator [Pseudorhodoplanes sp.]|uniref:MarR family winged helix-turn-helix transcriptional regulator n=1 Tax=Pseudorhodoplanes sp. TaxID=1934341 RepID=UPI003D14DDD0